LIHSGHSWERRHHSKETVHHSKETVTWLKTAGVAFIH